MNFFLTLMAMTVLTGFVESYPTAAAQPARAVEMKVRTLVVDPTTNTPVVLLEAIADKQVLPIWIDVPEARAISFELEKVKPPRPLTHDLIRNILDSLGATVQRITITELRASTYLATILLSQKGNEQQIDSRPSDAIAIALRMRAPIFATTQVLQSSKSLPTQSGRTEQTQKRLGIHTQDLTPELAKLMDSQTQRGVIVADVIAGSAATKTNIQRGDIITRVDDQPIDSVAELEAIVRNVRTPGRVRLEFMRKGKPSTAMIELP